MPELTMMHFGLLGGALIVGLLAGWFIRADRCAKEKIAVNASWQDQLESQQSEHNRLSEQNKSLMEQISQYQASQKDYANRAKELSDSLKETFARRDELQRQLKDMRGNLEVALAQRNRLREELADHPKSKTDSAKEKDDKIFKLSRELTSWQSRVPPLVERFQEKDKEARALQDELDKAQTRLQALEDLVKSDNTRIEPVDAEALPDGGDASNEPIAMTSAHDTSAMQDQTDEIADDEPEDTVFGVEDFVEPADISAPVDNIVSVEEFMDADETEVESEAEASENEGNGFDAVFAEEEDERDDLKKIKGIGPSIEKTLNDLGVFRFHQIAEMSEYDIDRVAQQLKGFRSRIYREDWIGQARDLQYEKNNSRT